MINATMNELEQLFLSAEVAQTRSICVTACHAQSGVSSITSALAERYLLAGYSTLLVDLNLLGSAYTPQPCLTTEDESEIQWLQANDHHGIFTGITVAKTGADVVSYRNPHYLSEKIETWHRDFERIIIDTSPILDHSEGIIPAQSIARACQHTLIVVQGGETKQAQLVKAFELLKQADANVLGCMLNNHNQATLGQEMVRELNRCKFLPKSIRTKWSKKLLNNEWLSHIA